jgi:hypothetical protein
MRQAMKALAIWIGCVVALEAFVFAVAFGLAGAGRQVTLSRDWRTTAGIVMAVDRGNHNSVTVHYTVDGRQIEQTFSGSEKNIGDGVEVYYSPNDGHLADIENPTLSVRNDLRFLSLAALALGTFASVFINFRSAGRALAWPLVSVRLSPRFAMIWIAIAVLAGIVSGLLFAPVGRQAWLPHAFTVCGVFLLCLRAFRLAGEASWNRFVRSPIVVLGVALVVISQLIRWAGQHG